MDREDRLGQVRQLILGRLRLLLRLVHQVELPLQEAVGPRLHRLPLPILHHGDIAKVARSQLIYMAIGGIAAIVLGINEHFLLQ